LVGGDGGSPVVSRPTRTALAWAGADHIPSASNKVLTPAHWRFALLCLAILSARPKPLSPSKAGRTGLISANNTAGALMITKDDVQAKLDALHKPHRQLGAALEALAIEFAVASQPNADDPPVGWCCSAADHVVA
jgi:hypothetical protein